MPVKDLTVSEDNYYLGTSVRGGQETYQSLRVTSRTNLATEWMRKYQIKDKREKNKYLGYCYLRIKCCPANPLAALMWRWCLNSEHAALQLRMEGSRKGKRSREKGLPTPDPHVDGGNGKKAIVYNTKKRKKGETRKKD